MNRVTVARPGVLGHGDFKNDPLATIFDTKCQHKLFFKYSKTRLIKLNKSNSFPFFLNKLLNTNIIRVIEWSNTLTESL